MEAICSTTHRFVYSTILRVLRIVGGRTDRKVCFRRDVPRNLAAHRTLQLYFYQVSNRPCLNRFPLRLALRTPDITKFVRVASSKVKQNAEQRVDHDQNYNTEQNKI